MIQQQIQIVPDFIDIKHLYPRYDVPVVHSFVGNKRKHSDIVSQSDVHADEVDPIKKRRMNYTNYMNRPTPLNLHKKELPEGKSECLAGLCFVRTGVLDSLMENDFTQLILKYGGRTVTKISGKVNYVVAGSHTGSKLEIAKLKKIPVLSEDDLLDMILLRSGVTPKYKNQKKTVQLDNELNSHSKVECGNKNLFLEKYKPDKFENLLGINKLNSSLFQIFSWLQTWNKDESPNAAILSGPPGAGKTLHTHLVAKKLGYSLNEFDASQTNILTLQLYIQSINVSNGEKVLIVIDKIDVLHQEKNSYDALFDIVAKIRIPIILICCTIEHTLLETLVNKCVHLRFANCYDSDELMYYLMEICLEEHIKITSKTLKRIIDDCGGNLLQAMDCLWNEKVKSACLKNELFG